MQIGTRSLLQGVSECVQPNHDALRRYFCPWETPAPKPVKGPAPTQKTGIHLALSVLTSRVRPLAYSLLPAQHWQQSRFVDHPKILGEAMTDLYRVERPDGSIEYTDVPSGAGKVRSVGRGSTREREQQQEPYDPKQAERLIREVQKRVPKVVDYLNYLEYLRHNSPIRFDQVMDQLRREDPQTWLKLQKYPQFRPLRETVVGLKAGTNLIGASINLATGKFTSGTEKWMETTLQALMKRDRWGPYADVLGAKATTLPTKTATYSNSRLGQYLKAEDARLANASKAVAKEAQVAREGLRAARGSMVTRPMGTVVDVGFAALNPDTAVATTQILMRARIEKAARRNPSFDIDTPAYEQARQLLSMGRYGDLDAFLKRYE